MKFIAKVLCIGALLTAATLIAKADPLNQISFAGNNVIDQTTGSVHFTDANGVASGNAYTGVATGIFAPFGGGAATFHDFNYLSTNVPFTLISDAAAGLSAIFSVTNLTYVMDPVFGLAIAGSGQYVVSNGTTIDDGTFLFTTQNSGGNVTFSDTNSIAVTPEPNSLMLLGTGLVSAAGMLVRRRRALA